MSDRLKGFVVTFDTDIRDDDAQALRDAIRCLKHVIHVAPVVADLTDVMARARVRSELRDKMLDILAS